MHRIDERSRLGPGQHHAVLAHHVAMNDPVPALLPNDLETAGAAIDVGMRGRAWIVGADRVSGNVGAPGSRAHFGGAAASPGLHARSAANGPCGPMPAGTAADVVALPAGADS